MQLRQTGNIVSQLNNYIFYIGTLLIYTILIKNKFNEQ